MTASALMATAWLLEACLGWPQWLYKRIRHPAVWIGYLVQGFDRALNRPDWPASWRFVAGAFATLCTVLLVTLLAVGIHLVLSDSWTGLAMEAVIASSLIASRSLFEHVSAVLRALADNELGDSQHALAKLVGRDTHCLDSSGVTRACLESLAENTSDGVIAPIFWGVLFGLPGLAAYKAVNTLDSMIGHRTARYGAFGCFAARLDDVANWIPARLSGILFAGVSLSQNAFRVMWRDAKKHRSPNAGWPQAALAGSLGVRLSGPRMYAKRRHQEPWLNSGGRDPQAADLERGLTLYARTLAMAAVILILLALSDQYAG